MRKARTRGRASAGRAKATAPPNLENLASQGVAAADPESASATETPRRDADVLIAVLDRFRSRFPETWDRLRLCPLQHGVETIGEMLRVARPRG